MYGADQFGKINLHFQTLAASLFHIEKGYSMPCLILYPDAVSMMDFAMNNNFIKWLDEEEMAIAMKILFKRVREVPYLDSIRRKRKESAEDVDVEKMSEAEKAFHDNDQDQLEDTPIAEPSRAEGKGHVAAVIEWLSKDTVPVPPIGSMPEYYVYAGLNMAFKSAGYGRYMSGAKFQVRLQTVSLDKSKYFRNF